MYLTSYFPGTLVIPSIGSMNSKHEFSLCKETMTGTKTTKAVANPKCTHSFGICGVTGFLVLPVVLGFFLQLSFPERNFS